MKSTPYTIRAAIPEDVEAIVAMHARSWLDTYPNKALGVTREWVQERTSRWFEAEALEKRRDIIRRCENNSDALYCVAQNERGEIVGMVAPFRNEQIQRVGAIYVEKEYHGSGLAQALMDRVIAWADPHRPLELTVTTYNERAKAFYRKYGFEEIEGSEHIVHDKLPVITMIRKGEKQ